MSNSIQFFIFLVEIFFIVSCTSSPVFVPTTQANSPIEKKVEKNASMVEYPKRNDINLAILSESSNTSKEVENFCSMVHNGIGQYISIVRPNIDNISIAVLPDEIHTYTQLIHTSADFVLYIDISFESRHDPAIPQSEWIYAVAKMEIQEPIEKKTLWKDSKTTSKGVLNWGDTIHTRNKVLEELSKEVIPILAHVIYSLPNGQKYKIRLISLCDTPQTLKIWQNELLRLEKAKHFKMEPNVLAMSCLLASWIEYKDNPLKLKALFEEALQSVSLSVQIRLAEKLILLEIEQK